MHILDEFYIKQKEKIYIQHNVVNIKQVEKQQEELFQLDEYLPNLLRSNLPYSYHKQLESSEKNGDIIKQMYKSKRFTDEEETIEFINWVDKHNQFKDLINEKEVKKLGDELEKLEKLVCKRGFDWLVIDDKKAKRSYKKDEERIKRNDEMILEKRKENEKFWQEKSKMTKEMNQKRMADISDKMANRNMDFLLR